MSIEGLNFENDQGLNFCLSIIAFSKKVEQYAANQGAYAFIIGRTGRPESELPKGIKYTQPDEEVVEIENGEVLKKEKIQTERWIDILKKEGKELVSYLVPKVSIIDNIT